MAARKQAEIEQDIITSQLPQMPTPNDHKPTRHLLLKSPLSPKSSSKLRNMPLIQVLVRDNPDTDYTNLFLEFSSNSV